LLVTAPSLAGMQGAATAGRAAGAGCAANVAAASGVAGEHAVRQAPASSKQGRDDRSMVRIPFTSK